MKNILPFIAILAVASAVQAQNLSVRVPQPFELIAMRLSTDLTP